MLGFLARLIVPMVALAALIVAACAPVPAPVSRGGRPRYFGSVTPPRDNTLRLNLGAEPETIDPGLATGQPDGRVCRVLFEGLTREDPRTLAPLPGQAYRWDISPDGTRYTFHLRPGLTWSDGTPLTARDFRWSWLRVLTPATGSRNAGLFARIANAERLTRGDLRDPGQVGLLAPDDSTLVVRLEAPTPYFLYLTQLPLALPCPRHALERYGDRWTLPANLVCNGAFRLAYWRQNDRFEFVRNPRYWDAGHVRLDRVVAYTIDDLNTSTNLYKAGVIDWNPSGNIPSPFVPYLRDYADFSHGRYQAIYFYSVNVTRKPFDDVWVRRALNYALDREAIAHDLLKGSREAWGNFTPSGYPGYRAPPPITFDPERARRCLAKAGYPGGRGFPAIEITFNTSEDHRRIAEAVQAMWRRELHIDVRLANQEWGSFLKAVTHLEYDVAGRSWIGDYLDPNTFLACYVSGDGNNRTGWSDAHYDRLIAAASRENDAARRLEMLSEAESQLLSDGPVIPIYHYATNELVKPYVRGMFPTPLDVHPLTAVWIDRAWDRPAPPR